VSSPGAGSDPGSGGKRSAGGGGGGYFAVSERPLTSLFFILPMIAVYEAGIRWLTHVTFSDSGAAVSSQPQIVAFTLMQRFFFALGANGAMLPALAVVIVLLAWHIARRDGWTIRFGVLVGMAVESVLLAVPLVGIGFAVANHLPLWTLPRDRETANFVVLSFGAGVYEEAVFRLGALTLVCVLLCDVLRLPSKFGVPSAVLASSLLFAGYHYWGAEIFAWRSMVFRSLAGVYFAILFLTRGFGVTVGVHAAYDLSILVLRQFAADAE
jgi:hypothetical protein